VKNRNPIRYQPSLPKKNDNITHTRPMREFLLLFGGVIVLFLALFWSLGLFVDIAVNAISPEKEAVLFAKARFDWMKKKSTDSVQQRYLQQLTDSIRPCLDVRFPVKVQLVKDKEPNAFAFPGGTIVVHSGLLKSVRSENGLAFVLAHELAHFKNRDHLRGLGRSIVLMALSSMLTGTSSDITRALTPVQLFGQAQYSQKRESEADKTALVTLNCKYGHVGGATEFFNALLKEKKLPDVTALHYFSSHPAMRKRIQTLDRMGDDMGFIVSETTPLK